MSKYKVNYRRVYEEYYKVKIPAGMHIHHIDGNKDNNNPANLLMVTPEEHEKIHIAQGDSWYNPKSGWISGASEAGKKGGASLKRKGKPGPNTGRKFSIETRKKLSDSHKGLTYKSSGKPRSEEHRAKLREAWIKRKQKWPNNWQWNKTCKEIHEN